jgi:hypothetical protein
LGGSQIKKFQKESWAAQVLRENCLVVGAAGSSQAVCARSKSQLDRKMNMRNLALEFANLDAKDYLERAISIMSDEM